ncbi:hypothetical protein GCM10029978_111790 [Actinoallomurus acanthiterrae]
MAATTRARAPDRSAVLSPNHEGRTMDMRCFALKESMDDGKTVLIGVKSRVGAFCSHVSALRSSG